VSEDQGLWSVLSNVNIAWVPWVMLLPSKAAFSYPAGELWDKSASYSFRGKEAEIFVSVEMAFFWSLWEKYKNLNFNHSLICLVFGNQK